MRLLSIDDLKAQGWRVEPNTEDAGYSHQLINPEGEKISAAVSEADAWAQYPDLPGCTYLEACDTTQNEKVLIAALNETANITTHVNQWGRWGWHFIVLTPDDLEALQTGNCIVWGQDEYSSLIYFHDPEVSQ